MRANYVNSSTSLFLFHTRAKTAGARRAGVATRSTRAAIVALARICSTTGRSPSISASSGKNAQKRGADATKGRSP